MRNRNQFYQSMVDQELKDLRKALFASNVQNDTLRMELAKQTEKESLAFSVVRSALSISEREGKETNWDAFSKKCRSVLDNK